MHSSLKPSSVGLTTEALGYDFTADGALPAGRRSVERLAEILSRLYEQGADFTLAENPTLSSP